MPAKSDNPTRSALYQRLLKVRKEMRERYKKQFPDKFQQMVAETTSGKGKNNALKKWDKIMEEDLSPNPKFEPIDMETVTPNLSGEVTPPVEEKKVKLFNPRSVEPDPRKMTFAELTEYVTQLGIDKWSAPPTEFLNVDSYVAANRVYAFHRWNARKEFLKVMKEQNTIWEFNKLLNDNRLRKIIEEARDRAKDELENKYIHTENGPEIRLFNGMVITKNTILNSPRKIGGNYRFQIGHLYAFYSEERDFLTILKVEKCFRDDDVESDRLVVRGTDFHGIFKTVYYRMDSTLALELG